MMLSNASSRQNASSFDIDVELTLGCRVQTANDSLLSLGQLP